ncbi:MAG TPA: histidine kinase N-terminal domain-containing protein, partial [Acidimicrobiia bacterium]|nr:histidine kinase N-terminal domain-containing protein [Acidimicrobiia bacterium]
MSTLDDLALARTSLSGSDLLHVERLVAAWQPLADLSFTDLLLFAPITGEEGHRFVVLAQVRPATG